MSWEDIAVLLIRSAGAMASALAGIAALMTDGALHKRKAPLTGFWRDTPFGRYKITRWGAILLAIILIAPAVQLGGDLLKDHFKDKKDASALENTTANIQRGVSSAIDASGQQSRQSIQDATISEFKKFDTVIKKQDGVASQTSQVASGATQILSDVQEMVYPFKDVEWAYELRLNLEDPRLADLRTFLREKETSHPGRSLGDGDVPTPFYELFSQQGNRMQADLYGDPRIYVDKDQFFVVNGPMVLVDLFDSNPREGSPLPKSVRSAKYSVGLKLILNPARLRTENSNKGSDRLVGPLYQLIYLPAKEGKPESDGLFVDYYRSVPDYFVFDKAQTIAGLPEVAGREFVVRLVERDDDDSTRVGKQDEFNGAASLYQLEAIRMRVGDREIIFPAGSFKSSYSRGCCMIYKLQMPNFDAIRRSLVPVTVNEDEFPLVQR